MENSDLDLDRLFDRALGSELPSAAGSQRAQESAANLRGLPERGLEFFCRGDYPRSLAELEGAAAAGHPAARALHSAATDLLAGHVSGGIRGCVQALRSSPAHADLYHALGVLLLRAGNRGKARTVFLRGLALAPRHPRLRESLRALGVRRLPVLSSLHRSHPLNRLLGMLRARVFSG
jgi:hypothetical protein